MIEIREPTRKDRILFWIMEHKKQIWLGFLAVLIGLLGLFYIGAARAKSTRESVARTAGLFLKWQGGDAAAYEDLSLLLKKSPSMAQKYQASIVQTLLNRNEIVKALPMAEKSLEGLELVEQKVFSRGSLLIAQGELQKALEEAEAASFESERLALYNMLRIAILEGKVGTPEGELLAWKHLEEKGIEKIQEDFQQRNLSLIDFINHRKAALK